MNVFVSCSKIGNFYLLYWWSFPWTSDGEAELEGRSYPDDIC